MLNFKTKPNHHSYEELGSDSCFRVFVLLLLVLILLPISLPVHANTLLDNNDAPFRVTKAPPLLKANGETLKELGFNNINKLLAAASIDDKSTVNSITFSPDGRFIASGSRDKTITRCSSF